MKKELKKIKEYDFSPCPEHGYTNVIFDYKTGEAVCGLCGLVLREQTMDKGPEWRAFTKEQKEARSRVGTPTTYSVHDKGLSTSISKTNRDAYGRELSLTAKLLAWRLRKWQARTRVYDSVERNLANAMGELDRLADQLYIPSLTKERAAVIYRKALEKGIVRGRSINAMIAASLYAACRGTKEVVRTLKEIEEASLVDKKDVSRCYRFLLKELNIQILPPEPIDYISKIAEKVGISGSTQGLAIKILHEAKKRGETDGRSPMGLAAGALYIACEQNKEMKCDRFGVKRKITQKEIAEAAGVTEVTVRNRYKSLKRRLKLN